MDQRLTDGWTDRWIDGQRKINKKSLKLNLTGIINISFASAFTLQKNWKFDNTEHLTLIAEHQCKLKKRHDLGKMCRQH